MTAGTTRHRLILITLIAASSLGVLASSIYIPSIPDMARDLTVPIGQVQLTVAIYVAAFGVSNLIVGPLSDRFGRRRILLIGTWLCFGASLLCAVADRIEVLMLGRLVQALGACAGITIARAVVRDLFDRDETARVIAAIAMVVTISPVLSPLLGGYLQVWFGWRANFYFLALSSAAVIALVTAQLPETNTNLQTQHGLIRGIFVSFSMLLRSRAFVGYALAISSVGACFYAFVAAAPVILIDIYGVSPDAFGIYCMVMPFGFLLGSYATSRLVGRIDLDRLILIGGLVLLAAGILQAAVFRIPSPWLMAIPFFLSGVSNGIVMPNVYAATVSLHPQIAGAAAGLTNAIQNMSAAVTTLLIAAVTLETSLAMAVTYIVTSLAVLAGAVLVRRGDR